MAALLAPVSALRLPAGRASARAGPVAMARPVPARGTRTTRRYRTLAPPAPRRPMWQAPEEECDVGCALVLEATQEELTAMQRNLQKQISATSEATLHMTARVDDMKCLLKSLEDAQKAKVEGDLRIASLQSELNRLKAAAAKQA